MNHKFYYKRVCVTRQKKKHRKLLIECDKFLRNMMCVKSFIINHELFQNVHQSHHIFFSYNVRQLPSIIYNI